MKYSELLIVILISFIFQGCQGQQGPLVERVVHQWAATSQQLAELQPRSDYEHYSMQLPNGFTQKTGNSNVKKPELFFSKNLKTTLTVEYGGTLYGPGKRPTTGEGLVLIVSKSLKNDVSNFQQSPPETGMIGDTEFAMKTWSGVESRSNLPMKGLIYCAVIDGKMVTITAQSLDEEGGTDLELAEAAIYTFEPK